MEHEEIYDLTIIGGGPVGLFGLFYAGMREMKTKVIDSLEQLCGQLIAIYPEKFIYDMPGFPRIKAKDLVRDMVEQGLQYGATTVLGEKVQTLRRREDQIWELCTDVGALHLSKTVVITVGAGGFAPRRLDLPGLRDLEGRDVFYFVTDLEVFRDRDVLIIGGGDSAVDWALHLEGIAKSLTLCHRRDKFRAHEGSIKELLSSSCEVNLFWEVKALHIEDERLRGVTIFHNKTGEERELGVDEMILSLGFHADLGPIQDRGRARGRPVPDPAAARRRYQRLGPNKHQPARRRADRRFMLRQRDSHLPQPHDALRRPHRRLPRRPLLVRAILPGPHSRWRRRGRTLAPTHRAFNLAPRQEGTSMPPAERVHGMKLQRCYRFRLEPTPEQEQAFRRFAGCRRYVWNWGLSRKIETYQTTGMSVGYHVLRANLVELKRIEATEFRKECHS